MPRGPQPTGDYFRADQSMIRPKETQFDKDAEYARKSQQHLWFAAVAHKVSPEMAERIAKGDPDAVPIFDMESLMSISIGCFICEQILDRTIVNRRCPGEPRQ